MADDEEEWSYDIEAEEPNVITNKSDIIQSDRTCTKTSYPHTFQLYMHSTNLFSPRTFSLSSSSKFYWQRICEAHNISISALNAVIADLNNCVLRYMLFAKLLWIIPWLCLPIGVIVYAVEDGYAHNHPEASIEVLNHHLFWSYNGLFLLVGGGIGGVLLATQLWSACWYRCIEAMSTKINALNNDALWLHHNCVSFDIQCDIPVLAGRSYGRAYYKIVISIHHDYLLQNVPITESLTPKKMENALHAHSEPAVVSLKQAPDEQQQQQQNMDLFKSLQVRWFVCVNDAYVRLRYFFCFYRHRFDADKSR